MRQDEATDAMSDGKVGVRFNWVVMGIGIASIATMVTTFFGMHAIFGNIPVAAVMTVLAQTVLIATSWIIGKDIARLATGRRDEIAMGTSPGTAVIRYAFLGGTFLLMLFICWFFSFNFYFNRLFQGGEDRLVAEQQPLTFAERVLPDLRKRVSTAYDASAAGIVQQASVQSYLSGLATVDDEAKNPDTKKSIADRVSAELAAQNKKAEQARADIGNLERQIEAAKQQKTAIQDQIRVQEAELVTVQRSIEPFRNQVERLDQERRAALEAAAKEEAEGAEGRPPGCGTVCNRQKDLAKTREVQIARISKETIGPLEARRKAIESKIADLQKSIDALDRGAADAGKSIETAKVLIGQSASETPASGEQAVEQLRQQFSARRTAFTSDPNPTTYEALTEVCARIVEPLRSVQKATERLAGTSCRSDSVALAIRGRPDMKTAQDTFLQQCSAEVANRKLGDIVVEARKVQGFDGPQRREVLAQALDKAQATVVQPCIALGSQAGAQTEDLQERVRRFVQTNTLRQDSFSQTRNAAFSLFEPGASNAARLGAAIAFAQDIFVLLLSILGDLGGRSRRLERHTGDRAFMRVNWAVRPGDAPMVVAAKSILHAARDNRNGSALLPKTFGQDLTPEIKENATQIIRHLVRNRSAWRRLGGSLLLLPEALGEIEQIVTESTATSAEMPPSERLQPRSPGPEPHSTLRLATTGGAATSAYTPADLPAGSISPPKGSESRSDIRSKIRESARRSADGGYFVAGPSSVVRNAGETADTSVRPDPQPAAGRVHPQPVRPFAATLASRAAKLRSDSDNGAA